ncbi:hypothetical protein A2U01_0068186 [Trifolium medium]|uniref:Uncharacterized protein n=1 Tax=Trifolium medium TaxID=97028 RepID=A0A392SG87_9FABA|nr:hypothetical protein [Trifolium medium]
MGVFVVVVEAFSSLLALSFCCSRWWWTAAGGSGGGDAGLPQGGGCWLPVRRSSMLRQFRRYEMDVMRGCGGCDDLRRGW